MKLDDAFDLIKRGFDSGRMAQSYVVNGAVRGNGVEFVDRVLQLVFCSAEDKPCGQCRGCRQGKEHTFPDLQLVEPLKKSRIIAIEQIRELQARIFQTSFYGGWKVCVVMSADRLGPEAANAFLKTLEEPPDSTLFLLLTDSPESLLPTIVSRCQRIDVSGDVDMLGHEWKVRLIEVLSEQIPLGAAVCLSKADRAAKLFKDMKEVAETEVLEALELSQLELKDGEVDARVLARYKEMREDLMRFLLSWYRDIFVLVCGADEKEVYNTGHLDYFRSHATGLGYRQAKANLSVVNAMNTQMERNVVEGPVLNYGFSRLV